MHNMQIKQIITKKTSQVRQINAKNLSVEFVNRSPIKQPLEEKKIAKLRRRSKLLGVDQDNDPILLLDRTKYFSDIGKLDPEYYELEYRYYGITRCTKAYVQKLADIKAVLMPKIRSFDRNYSLPKSLSIKGDCFELRSCIDLTTNESRSVKIFRKSELNDLRLSKLKKELSLLRALDHPNITKIFDVIEDEYKIYVIIEQIKGQSIFEYIIQNRQVSPTLTIIAVSQILSVIAYLHKRGMVLRRICLEYIFLVESNNIQDIRFTELFFCSTLEDIKQEPNDFLDKIY